MTPEMLTIPAVRSLANHTARQLGGGISAEMPRQISEKLVADTEIFAGFKTYHQLKEASEYIRTEDGKMKDFETFYADLEELCGKYNKTWARAEYNHIKYSAEMAARWEDIVADKDLYDLTYVTRGDARVRADHAKLDGITLPVSDPFWAVGYPPNGWNCRCDVVQVPRGSKKYSNSKRVIEDLDSEVKGNELFMYNAGMTGRVMPPRHPYYGKKGYDHCLNDQLARKMGKNEPCEVLGSLRDNQRIKQIEKSIKSWAKKNKGVYTAPTTKTGKILISSKITERFLYHARTEHEKKMLKEIVLHNERLTFIREDKLGSKKDLNNPRDAKNVEKKKNRGVLSYTVYSYEDEQGKWKVGFENMNSSEAPYYIFTTKKKRPK